MLLTSFFWAIEKCYSLNKPQLNSKSLIRSPMEFQCKPIDPWSPFIIFFFLCSCFWISKSTLYSIRKIMKVSENQLEEKGQRIIINEHETAEKKPKNKTDSSFFFFQQTILCNFCESFVFCYARRCIDCLLLLMFIGFAAQCVQCIYVYCPLPYENVIFTIWKKRNRPVACACFFFTLSLMVALYTASNCRILSFRLKRETILFFFSEFRLKGLFSHFFDYMPKCIYDDRYRINKFRLGAIILYSLHRFLHFIVHKRWIYGLFYKQKKKKKKNTSPISFKI